MNPKYDKFGRKERIIGPAGIFPTMTCRYADAHCMSENQPQEKGLCGFAVLEGTPLHPKRFAAPEEGCRAHGYCNLAISSTGDEREAYTHVGNLVNYTHKARGLDSSQGKSSWERCVLMTWTSQMSTSTSWQIRRQGAGSRRWEKCAPEK